MKSTIERTDTEELLKILCDEAPAGICIIQDGKFRYFNSNFPIAAGYTVDELVGKDSLEIVVPEDRETVKQNTIKMLKGQLRSPYQLRALHKDGGIAWIMAAVKSVRYHGRRAILGNYMEVTQHKQAEERIRESETRYRLLAENMEDVIWTVDIACPTRLTYVSPSVTRLLGYGVEESMAKEMAEVFTPASFDVAMKAFAEETASAKKEHSSRHRSRRLELQLMHKNGSLVDVEVSFSLIRAADGQNGEILAVARDVTEHKQAEEALRVAEEEKRALLDEAPISIIHTDLKGKITYVNKRFESESGYSQEETVGRNGFEMDLVPAGIMKYLARRMVARLTGKPGKHWETRFKCKGGGWIRVDLEGKVVRKSGVPVGFQIIAKDITAHKQAEEALQAEKNKLQSLIDAMQDTITIQDTEYNIVYQNEPSRIASGGDHLGEKCYQIYEGRESICEGCPVEKAFKDGKSHTSERKTTISGKVAFWENTANPIRDAEGTIVSCLELARDITDRKKQEQALADELTQRRLLIDKSLDGIVVLDVSARVAEANQRFAEMLGYTLEEVRDLHTWDWDKNFPPEQLLEMGRNVDEKGLHLQTKHTRKDGSVIDVDISISGITCGEQKLIFCIGRDVTERTQAEEALRTSQEMYKTLVEDAPMGIYYNDFSGTFLYGNKKAEEIVGYKKEELVGKSFLKLKLLTPGGIARAAKLLALNKLGKATGPDLFTLSRKDGATSTVEIHTKVSTLGGKKAVLGMVEDITERKEAEEALRQSEERYRTMLEEMEDSYSEVDLGGHFIFVNSTLCRDLGYSREEVLGMSYKKFAAEDDVDSVFQVYNEVYRTGMPNKGFSWKTTRKDGTHGFAETSVSPIRNDKSEIVGFRSVGRDITKRKKAEEELSKTQAKLSSAVQMAHLGPWEYDAINDLFFFSDAFYELFHTTAEDVGGYTMSSAEYARRFVHPGDAHLVTEEVRKALEADDPNFSSQVDHRIIYADGKVGYISVRFFIVKDEAGRTIRTYGVNQDITEHKQAEEALRQSKERYRSMLEEMEDAYSEVDLGGHFTFVNSSLCRDLGYSREELLGMSYKEFVAEDDSDSVFRVFNEVYRTGMPNKGFSWKTIRKDGTNGIAESSVSLIRNDKGEITGFRSVGRDVAKRKKMEEKLRQSEENYRALFDSSVIGTIVLDAETMKVVMVNRAAAEIFGFNSSEKVRGVDPLAFIHSEDRERVLQLAKKGLVERNSHQTHNLRGITKDGREIWVSATGTRIMHEGRLAGLVCFTDITEQKRQNERLMMADRLASIGELASGTAHELNNPLTSVIGFSQLLMEREVPDDIREDLKLINSEAQRAANVTKNLLTFARKHAPVKQLSQINNIIEDVLKLRAYEHRMNDIAVVKQIDPGLPEMMIDYFQMQQVFMNIIINAEYFMTAAHKKGRLSVTTRKQNGTVRISIADDGPGIRRENLKRIFDPFFTTKGTGKGTGLGLSICHGIVTEHGGQIYARSQPGEGAIIHVELPIDGVRTVSEEAVKEANPDQKRASIVNDKELQHA